MLTEGDVSDVILEIARGLECLHYNGIAHRDLKPSNIVCVYPGRLTPLKLIDFDLASEYIYDSSSPRQCVSTPRLRSPVGSFEYMAPDVVNVWRATQHDWSHTYDKRCDLWSLGVILYLLLCGYMPFRGKDCGRDCGWRRGYKCDECQDLLFDEILMGHYEFPDREWKGVSSEAKHLVSKLLVTNPLHRFSADEVLDHTWIYDQHLRARSNILQYASGRREGDRAGELSACVENANMANRLVHLHLDRERSAADSLAAAATGKSETGKGDERKCAVKFDLGDDSDDDDLEVGPDRTKGDKSRESISMGFDGGDGSISDGSLLKKGARCDIDRADRARDCGWNDASDDRDGSHNAEQSPGCGCSSSSSNWLPTDDRTTVASSGDANKWNGMTDNNNEDCYFGSVATIDCKTCQLYIAVDKDSGKGDSCSNDLCCHLNFHTCHATEP